MEAMRTYTHILVEHAADVFERWPSAVRRKARNITNNTHNPVEHVVAAYVHTSPVISLGVVEVLGGAEHQQQIRRLRN